MSVSNAAAVSVHQVHSSKRKLEVGIASEDFKVAVTPQAESLTGVTGELCSGVPISPPVLIRGVVVRTGSDTELRSCFTVFGAFGRQD